MPNILDVYVKSIITFVCGINLPLFGCIFIYNNYTNNPSFLLITSKSAWILLLFVKVLIILDDSPIFILPKYNGDVSFNIICTLCGIADNGIS